MRDTAPGANDCFRPPEIPIQVHCLHCHQEYDSYLMLWVEDATFNNGGYWACPTPGCDGKGFTFDIWPTDPEWTDEEGNKVFFLDDEPDTEEDHFQPDDDWVDDEVQADVLDEDLIGDDDVGDDELVLGDESALDDELEQDHGEWDLPASHRPADSPGFREDDEAPF
jgi:hypothetical protein